MSTQPWAPSERLDAAPTPPRPYSVVRTADSLGPVEAFALLHPTARAAAILWALATLKPAKTVWKASCYALKHDLDDDAGRHFYLTETEFAGAILAAGFKVGPRGHRQLCPYARARVRRRRTALGMPLASIRHASAGEMSAFDALVGEYRGAVQMERRDHVGIRRRHWEAP